MKVTNFLCIAGYVGVVLLNPSPTIASPPPGTYFDVLAYGAAGNGLVDNTEVVQHVVDLASARGGGTVYFPPGTYLQSAVRLKSNVTIWIDKGAEIRGNPERLARANPIFHDSHGKPFGPALFFADRAENVSVRGEGVIDGQGFKKNFPPEKGVTRPLLLLFKDCEKVQVQGLTLRNAAAWVQDYINCSDVRIQDLLVRSFANANNDGLDLDGSERVIITGCNISSGDDAIVLKSLSKHLCRDVSISNCVISGSKSAIKFGTESLGGFENVAISNCVIYGTRGIDLFSVDGGVLRNIAITNIVIRNAYGVLGIRLGARMRSYDVAPSDRPHEAGQIFGVLISGIQATGITESNDFIAGIPGHPVEHVTLRDIHIVYKGGGNKRDVRRRIPEKKASYPKKRMFGRLPAYGLYLRHVRNVRIYNVETSFEKADARPALFGDDVQNLELWDLRAAATDSTPAVIWLRNSRKAQLFNCRRVGSPGALVRLEGQETREIELLNCRHAGKTSLLVEEEDVPPEAVQIR